MRKFPKPVVVISRCLEFAPCRYNGERIAFGFLRRLEPFVRFAPVCPEVEIGLGTPREPIRIVRNEGRKRLVQPATGRDLTRPMEKFSEAYLGGLGAADGFILKSRSPSCGLRDAKVFGGSGSGTCVGKGPGLFAEEVLARFGGLAVEDEGRLGNFLLRERFLTKLFALAAFRKLKERPSMRALVRFQAENKLLLMAYSQKALKALGRAAANRAREPVERVLRAYEGHLRAAFARASRRPANVNVLTHAMGHFSGALKPKEKAFFLETLERYRERRVPLSAALLILRAWIVRFENGCLGAQTYFEPYPEALMEIAGPGKGRDL